MNINKHENVEDIEEMSFSYYDKTNRDDEVKIETHFEFVDSSSQEVRPTNLFMQNSKCIMAWSRDETKLMLQLYKEYVRSVGPLKEMKTKKEMWQKISSTLYNQYNIAFTATQVQNRYKNVVKRTKAYRRQNKRNPYENEVADIVAGGNSLISNALRTADIVETQSNHLSEAESNTIIAAVQTQAQPFLEQSPQLQIAPQSPPAEAVPSSSSRPSKTVHLEEKLLETLIKNAEERKRILQEIREIKKKSLEYKQQRHEERMKCLKGLTDAVLELSRNLQNK